MCVYVHVCLSEIVNDNDYNMYVYLQAQYVFIHDALNELITCGQTDIVASALRTKVNFLSKIVPAKGITGFQNQFQVTWKNTIPVHE